MSSGLPCTWVLVGIITNADRTLSTFCHQFEEFAPFCFCFLLGGRAKRSWFIVNFGVYVPMYVTHWDLIQLAPEKAMLLCSGVHCWQRNNGQPRAVNGGVQKLVTQHLHTIVAVLFQSLLLLLLYVCISQSMSLCYNGRIVLYFAKVLSLCFVCVCVCVCVCAGDGCQCDRGGTKGTYFWSGHQQECHYWRGRVPKGIYTMCNVCVCVRWGVYIDCRVQGLSNTRDT